MKYQKLLSLKNSIASKRIENRIPKVVKIEIAAAQISAILINFSFNSLCFFLDSKVLNTFAFVLNLVKILSKFGYKMVTVYKMLEIGLFEPFEAFFKAFKVLSKSDIFD